MKGAVSGETRRGAANMLRSGGTRMGEPGTGHAVSPYTEYIGMRG